MAAHLLVRPRSAMTPCLLLLVLLAFISVPAMALYRYHPDKPAGRLTVAQDALHTLVSGPLRGQDLLLVTGDGIQDLVDVDSMVEAAGGALTPVVHTNQNSLLQTPHPVRHTKGTSLTAMLLFSHDPVSFLLLLAGNLNWSPSYLILFCLNPHVNTTSVLSQAVVQRSLYIILLELTERGGKPVLHAYTSLPTHLSSQGQPLIKTSVGKWNSDMYESRQSLFPPRYHDFGGYVLAASVLCFEEPFLYFVESGECIGANKDALQIIGDKLNFKFILTSPDEVIWGFKENGTWNGLLGDLMYRGRHISVNVLQPSPDRASEFDITYPYWEDGFGILLRVPEPMPQWRNILYPFSSLMWGLIVAITVIIPTLLAVFLRLFDNIDDPVGVAFKVAAGMVQQSVIVRKLMTWWWVRTWLMTWWLAAQSILSNVYQGHLVAVLAVPVYPPVINTVHELAESNYIPSMLEYGDFAPHALRTSENPTLATIGRKLYMDYVWSPPDIYANLLTKVMKGTHALMVTIDYLVFTQRSKGLTHDTYIMNERVFGSYMCWFLPRNTPYTKIISDHHMRLLETGVMRKLYEQHIGGLIGREEQVHGDGVLNLDHLQGAFIVLVLGLVVSATALVLERLA